MSTNEVSPLTIEALIQQTPSCALTDPAKKQELYRFLENEIAAFVPDLETEKGRKAIAALAYKIARTKTAIDDAGAELKAEWLRKSQAIDAGRREIRDRLDALKEKAREPLTRWEKDEEGRQANIKASFEFLQAITIVTTTMTSADVKDKLEQAQDFILDERTFREMYQPVLGARAAAVRSLRASLDRITEDEFDREELARLREIQAKRDEEDRKAAQEKERLQFEADRKERERIAEEDRAAQKQLDIDKAIDRERQRVADEAARLNREAEKKLADEKKLAANKKHRAAVVKVAALALMKESGLDETACRNVIELITDGKIPAVSISFTGETK